MADPIRFDPPRPAWMQFQPGGWTATLLYGWERRDDGWWGDVDARGDYDHHQRTRVWQPAAGLRPRDPAFPEQSVRCLGDPP